MSFRSCEKSDKEEMWKFFQDCINLGLFIVYS